MYLITGATGNVGAALVAALTHANVPVRALTRSPGPARLASGVEAVTGDLDRPASLREALAGVRGVFLLPGYQDMPGLLSEIVRAGVERVVLLSGHSAGSGDLSNAIAAYMIRSEEAVRDSGLPWTILRPTAFMSNALRWLPQLATGNVIRAAFPNIRTATIDPHDIAAVAAEALRGAGHDQRTYELTGPESLLPADQVLILSQVLGKELTFEGLSDEAAREEMARTTPPEYVAAFFDFYAAGSLDESQVNSTVKTVTGREPRTLEQWVNAHADAFG